MHRLHADPSTWEAGPSLLLTPDSVLLYPSGSVLFCRGALGKLTDGEGEGEGCSGGRGVHDTLDPCYDGCR